MNASGAISIGREQKVIPASIRSDGSIRKERKVRPGFVAEEDVTRYRPPFARLEALKRSTNDSALKAIKKESVKEPLKEIIKESVKESTMDTKEPLKQPKIKNLKKKLRQIHELEQKQSLGTCLLPEQLEKIAKKNSIEKELEQAMAQLSIL